MFCSYKSDFCPWGHLHCKSLPGALILHFSTLRQIFSEIRSGLVHQVWFIYYLKTRWHLLFTPQIHQLTCAVLPCGTEGNSSLNLSAFRLWPYHYFSVCSYAFYYWSQNYSSPFSNPAILFDFVTSSGSRSQRQFSAFAKTVTERLMLKDENTLSHLWCLKRGERPQDLSAYYTV